MSGNGKWCQRHDCQHNKACHTTKRGGCVYCRCWQFMPVRKPSLSGFTMQQLVESAERKLHQ